MHIQQIRRILPGVVTTALLVFSAAPVHVGLAASGQDSAAIVAIDAITAADWLKQPSGALLDRVIAASSKESLDAAVAKDPRAQALVGSAHLSGLHGYAKSEAEAVKFYRLAAGSNPIAQNNLGNLLLTGVANGGTAAPAEAVEMFRRAAKQGHPVAQYNLGRLYADGVGVGKDVAKAMEYLALAAAQGNSAAKDSLAALKAQAAAESDAERWKRLEAAAATGDADALYALAQAYEELDDGSEEGYSVIQSSYQDALNAYVRDAGAGNVPAMQRAADMFYVGVGTRRDVKQAFENYQRAAAAGDAWSQMRLGQMYERGESVTADPGEAIRLYQLAARQGQPDAQRKLRELGKNW
jgi:TPR repeat protein